MLHDKFVGCNTLMTSEQWPIEDGYLTEKNKISGNYTYVS